MRLFHCCVNMVEKEAMNYDKNGNYVGKGKGDLND